MLCIARTTPSQDVRPSVCLSVTPYSVETVTHIIKLYHRRVPHHPIFFHTKRYGNTPMGTPLTGGVECKGIWKTRFILEMIQDRTIYGRWIGNRTQAFELYQFQWPWVTANPDFKVTPLFYADYLRNGTRYRHTRSYNEILIGTYTLLKTVISNDLEWAWVT